MLYADRQPSGPQPGMLAVAVIGAVFGGLLGSAFGLGSVHEMINVGSWLNALVSSGALLSIYDVSSGSAMKALGPRLSEFGH
jgi:uncharacterized membrane protein YeaQ/YmgE (transglycosylase-associated protein family)